MTYPNNAQCKCQQINKCHSVDLVKMITKKRIPIYQSIYLFYFCFFQYSSRKNKYSIKPGQWLDSNCRPLGSEATTAPKRIPILWEIDTYITHDIKGHGWITGIRYIGFIRIKFKKSHSPSKRKLKSHVPTSLNMLSGLLIEHSSGERSQLRDADPSAPVTPSPLCVTSPGGTNNNKTFSLTYWNVCNHPW